jgi:phage gp36-like protein
MADPGLVSGEQVEAYLSSPVVMDTLDDDNDGTIDTVAMAQVLADSQAYFLATVRGMYELPLTAPIDPFVVTVILHIVHCQLVKRFPERFKKGVKICEEAKELLQDIRKGDLQLAHPVRGDGFTPQCASYEPRGYEKLEGGESGQT